MRPDKDIEPEIAAGIWHILAWPPKTIGGGLARMVADHRVLLLVLLAILALGSYAALVSYHLWLGIGVDQATEWDEIVYTLDTPWREAWVCPDVFWALKWLVAWPLGLSILYCFGRDLKNIILDKKSERNRARIKVSQGKVRRALKRRRKPKQGQVYLGKHGWLRKRVLDQAMREAHTHLVGGTGTGKTAFVLTPIIATDIHAGRGTLIIDGKGDMDLLAAVEREARLAGRDQDLRLLDMARPSRSVRINPLAYGSQAELTDLILQAGKWESEYYKGQAETALLEALGVLLQAAHQEHVRSPRQIQVTPLTLPGSATPALSTGVADPGAGRSLALVPYGSGPARTGNQYADGRVRPRNRVGEARPGDMENSGPHPMGAAAPVLPLVPDWAAIDTDDVWTPNRFTMADLYRVIAEPGFLTQLAEQFHLPHAGQIKAWLEQAHEKHSISGLMALLAKVVRTQFGQLFLESRPELDLFDMYTNNRIVYCSLQTGRFSASAPFVGRLIMAQLNIVSNLIVQYLPREQRKFFPVVIDEFAGFAYPEFIEFLNKSRASGFACTLAHQTLGDLDRMGSHFRQQVIGNTALKIILRQEYPEDAEVWARMIGTLTGWEMTEQIEQGLLMTSRTGLGSRREVEKFPVHPNEIKSLNNGEAIVVHKARGVATIPR